MSKPELREIKELSEKDIIQTRNIQRAEFEKMRLLDKNAAIS